MRSYQQQHSDLGQQWRSIMKGELPADWETHLPDFKDAKPVATRVASGEVINALAPHLPMLIGGSADLGCQTIPTSRVAAILRRVPTADG